MRKLEGRTSEAEEKAGTKGPVGGMCLASFREEQSRVRLQWS